MGTQSSTSDKPASSESSQEKPDTGAPPSPNKPSYDPFAQFLTTQDSQHEARMADEARREAEQAQQPAGQGESAADKEVRLMLERYEPVNPATRPRRNDGRDHGFMDNLPNQGPWTRNDDRVRREVDKRNQKAISAWEKQTGKKYDKAQAKDVQWTTHHTAKSAAAHGSSEHPDKFVQPESRLWRGKLISKTNRPPQADHDIQYEQTWGRGL